MSDLTLTEYTDTGARELDLPDANSYAAVIDLVLACLAGRATSRLTPASVSTASSPASTSAPNSPASETRNGFFV